MAPLTSSSSSRKSDYASDGKRAIAITVGTVLGVVVLLVIAGFLYYRLSQAEEGMLAEQYDARQRRRSRYRKRISNHRRYGGGGSVGGGSNGPRGNRSCLQVFCTACCVMAPENDDHGDGRRPGMDDGGYWGPRPKTYRGSGGESGDIPPWYKRPQMPRFPGPRRWPHGRDDGDDDDDEHPRGRSRQRGAGRPLPLEPRVPSDPEPTKWRSRRYSNVDIGFRLTKAQQTHRGSYPRPPPIKTPKSESPASSTVYVLD
ncbi:hypothetical protein EDC01DRAFT_790292 [Geopyxis carbonaria]|nr:hypothetical protein EDC01DRAFT_790292 [Geopyxis carbonaria]